MPIDYDRVLYRERNIVERAIGWLKQSRRIATRYKKGGSHLSGFCPVRCSSSLAAQPVCLCPQTLEQSESSAFGKVDSGLPRGLGTVRGHPSPAQLPRLGGCRRHYRLHQIPDDPSCGGCGRLLIAYRGCQA